MENSSTDTAKPAPDTPRIQVNWDEIRRGYMAGESIPSLATRYGLKKDTVKTRAVRGNWSVMRKLGAPTAKKMAKAVIASQLEAAHSAVTEQAKLAIQQWQQTSIGIAGRIRDEVQGRVRPETESKELEVLAKTLDVTDRVGRRSYGLDSPDQSSATRDVRSVIGIRLELIGGPSPSEPVVIDAVSEPV